MSIKRKSCDSDNLSDSESKLKRESKIISVRSDFTDEDDDPSVSDNSECELSDDDWDSKSKKSRKKRKCTLNIKPAQTFKKKLAEKTKAKQKSSRSSIQNVTDSENSKDQVEKKNIDKFDKKELNETENCVEIESKKSNSTIDNIEIKEFEIKLVKTNSESKSAEITQTKSENKNLKKSEHEHLLKIDEKDKNIQNEQHLLETNTNDELNTLKFSKIRKVHNVKESKSCKTEEIETILIDDIEDVSTPISNEKQPKVITVSATLNLSSVSPLLLNHTTNVNSTNTLSNHNPVSNINSSSTMSPSNSSPLVPGIYFNPNATSPSVFHNNAMYSPTVSSNMINFPNNLPSTPVYPNNVNINQFTPPNTLTHNLSNQNQINSYIPLNRIRTPRQVTPTNVRKPRMINSTPRSTYRPRKLFNDQVSSTTTPVKNNVYSSRSTSVTSKSPVKSSYTSTQANRSSLILNNISPRGQYLYKGNSSVTIIPKTPERPPVQRKLNKSEVEGTITARSEDGFLRYVVNLANGTHIKLSNLQVQKLREQNNGMLPTKLRIPVPSDVAASIEPSFLIED